MINRPAPYEARRDSKSNASGRYRIHYGAIRNVGSALPEINLIIQGLTAEVCTEINRGVGITGIPAGISFGVLGTDWLNLSEVAWPAPGVLPNLTANGIGEEPQAGPLIGQKTFCYCTNNPCDNSDPNDYIFVNVLLER